jgi:transcriptional regulator GlxA family with amidase domain
MRENVRGGKLFLQTLCRLISIWRKRSDVNESGDTSVRPSGSDDGSSIEIVYRLLIGEQGHRMYHLTTIGGHPHRIVRAVKKLREDFAKPLRIEDIAREIGMSVSGFHAHFKAVTAMSPLQFQKRLRLQEARRLMLTESLDAAEAGFQVGYDDASHFSREYKRHFGDPPLRDIQGLRELTLVSQAA